MFYRRNLIAMIVVILGLVMFVPVAQAERQEIEGIVCVSNTNTPVQSTPGQIYIASFDGKGIFQSTHQNKLENNNTIHQIGVMKTVGAKLVWNGLYKTMRPDGDYAIYEFSGDTASGSISKMIYGTGRYKGAKGESTSIFITTGKPIVQDTNQNCQKSVGWIEFATSTPSTTSSQSLPAKPIRDFKEIAGKWEGKLDGPGWSSKMTVIFNNDGTGDNFVTEDSPIFIYSEKGRFPIERKLMDGKIRTKNLLSGGTGITTLHEEGGKRYLKSQSDDGSQLGIYEQAK
jgi:hypothetical protein